jgi:hypothetical protein
MKNVHAHWAVYPDFLQLGKFTITNRDEARQWCLDNCKNKFISSDVFAWAFLDESDAKEFSKQYGGNIVFKDKEV